MWKGALALGLLSIVVALPLPGCVEAIFVSAPRELAERPSSTPEYAAIARHLRQRFDGYGATDVVVPQFSIVALSHMASGLVNVYVAEPQMRSEVHELLGEVVRRAVSARVSPRGLPTTEATRLDDYNLFWSHLALVLGAERFARCDGRPCPDEGENDRLLERVVAHLRARSLASAVFQAPSYPGSPVWPADQTVTLLALRLYDATHGTSLCDQPLRGFLAWARAHRDARTGLFWSSGSLSVSHAETPRGCAASWSASYLVQLDPVVALEQYERERQALHGDVLGVGGFREWPAGREFGGDVDSGPIVFGVGVAATGLGLAPARIFRDEDRYTVIRRAALVFGVPAWWPWRGYWAAPLLGEAILFDGRTARGWFGDVPAVDVKRAPAPTGPVALALANVGLLVLTAARSRSVFVAFG
jgi:hypothetical protein